MRSEVTAVTGRNGPQQSHWLDQVITGSAFDRAAAAFAEAAEAARARDLDQARRLAVQADGWLGWAGWAMNGLHYVPSVPPPRHGADDSASPASPALR